MNEYSNRYSLFGLRIFSQIEIPELASLASPMDTGDVFIRQAILPDALPDAAVQRPFFDASVDRLLIHLENLGRILVEGGQLITVDPDPLGPPQVFRSILLNWGLGMVLHQRGFLPLHASAVAGPHGAVVFCGHPGVGKSTTAAALSQRGYELVSDDKLVVALQDDSIRIYPSFPHVRLWADAARHLNISTQDATRVVADADKFILAVKEGFASHPLPLQAIFILAPRNVPDVQFVNLRGMDKFRALNMHTYGRRFLGAMGLRPSHFHLATGVAAKVPVIRAIRPMSIENLNRLIDQLEKLMLQPVVSVEVTR